MKLLQRILLLLLSLSVLGYGSAWAFDGHVIEANSNETGVLFQATGFQITGLQATWHVQAQNSLPAETSVDPGGDTDHASHKSCDHCCHISAHLQAIFSQQAAVHSCDNAGLRHEYHEHFLSCTSSPDLRPPRV